MSPGPDCRGPRTSYVSRCGWLKPHRNVVANTVWKICINVFLEPRIDWTELEKKRRRPRCDQCQREDRDRFSFVGGQNVFRFWNDGYGLGRQMITDTSERLHAIKIYRLWGSLFKCGLDSECVTAG